MSSFSSKNDTTINALIKKLGDQEPGFYSLGTPFLTDTKITRKLVDMGKIALPHLINALGSENDKIVMYTIYCLGQIGDKSILPFLKETKKKYLTKKNRGEYYFGVLSVINKVESYFVDAKKSS